MSFREVGLVGKRHHVLEWEGADFFCGGECMGQCNVMYRENAAFLGQPVLKLL